MLENDEMLPGMDAIKRTLGANETNLKQTIDAYLQEGSLDAVKDSALISLAFSSAQALDNTSVDEKASGKSSLIKTYLSVLETIHERVENKKTVNATAENHAPAHARVLSVING